jgi:hypothetical protein
MKCRNATTLTVLVMAFPLSAHAEVVPARASVKAGKAISPATKRIKQKDGSIVIRLAMPKEAQGKNAKDVSPPSTTGPMLGGVPEKTTPNVREWLEAVTEPRFMTALASVAMEPGVATRTLNKPIDPALVRNWAEFIDPNLYMRWMAAGVDSRYNQAILKQSPDSRNLLHAWLLPINNLVPGFAQAGVPLNTTLWSHAFGEGPSGQEAAKEWLKLPMPDPKANPWLSNSLNYRY